MRINGCIRAERNLYAAGKCMGDVLARRGHDCFSFDQQEIRNMILRCVLDEPVAQIKGRHQVRAILLHFGDCSIVDVGTVLYRIHARLRRPQNPLRSMGVGCNLAAKAMRIRDNGLHLFQGVLRGLGIVAFGQHAPRCAYFDQIRTVLNHLTRFVLNTLNAICYAFRGSVIFKRKQVLITVAAGNSQSWPADQHSWAGNVPCVDCVPQSHVAVALSADVADRGEPSFQGEPRIASTGQVARGIEIPSDWYPILRGSPVRWVCASVSPGRTVALGRSMRWSLAERRTCTIGPTLTILSPSITMA